MTIAAVSSLNEGRWIPRHEMPPTDVRFPLEGEVTFDPPRRVVRPVTRQRAIVHRTIPAREEVAI